MQKPHVIILWLFQDLRLNDQPALHFAQKYKMPIIPLYAYDDKQYTFLGLRNKWWLHKSLESLNLDLKNLESQLIIRKDSPQKILSSLSEQCTIDRVVWNSPTLQGFQESEKLLVSTLNKLQISYQSFNSSFLINPEILSFDHLKNFESYYSYLSKHFSPSSPLIAIPFLPLNSLEIPSLSIDKLNLEPESEWIKGVKACWDPGERSALNRLKYFIYHDLYAYLSMKDRLDLFLSSKFEAHLLFGEITLSTIFREVMNAADLIEDPSYSQNAYQFLKDLALNEFFILKAYLKQKNNINYISQKGLSINKEIKEWIDRWKQGKSGFPLLDAITRELLTQGWMHPKALAICASYFLSHCGYIPKEVSDYLKEMRLGSTFIADEEYLSDKNRLFVHFKEHFSLFLSRETQIVDPHESYVQRWAPDLVTTCSGNLHTNDLITK